jgi:transposase
VEQSPVSLAKRTRMLSLSQTTRIFLCREPTDMRLGYEGLRNRVKNLFHENPLSGHLFVFFNKSLNRCKILFYDHGGLCLFCKRLEMGTFSIPTIKQIGERTEIDRVEFILFLDGIISLGLKRKKRFLPSDNN